MGETSATGGGDALQRTPLHGLHIELGARMVPFAGYDMPVQYPAGILAEHKQTRDAAGLFDVSHMGQAFLIGPDHETTARALEALTPGNFIGLAAGRQRYTLFLNAEGGILDDLMVTRPSDPEKEGWLYVVVNAACKDQDYAHLQANLPEDVTLKVLEDRALLALQGPKAAMALARSCKDADGLSFMQADHMKIGGIDCHVSRSGYTGEDGFEISVAAGDAEALARALLAEPEVEAIGLGARDSLRLEAGLCLYGHDIDTTTSPAEADLGWAVPKRRREEANFPGAERIVREFADGPSRRRVGIAPEGRAPVREGTEIQSAEGKPIGTVTSGGFGPSVGGPVAMGYVGADHAAPGTSLALILRGKPVPARVAELPFVAHNYRR